MHLNQLQQVELMENDLGKEIDVPVPVLSQEFLSHEMQF